MSEELETAEGDARQLSADEVHALVASSSDDLRAALRDLLATIELHTDCMDGHINREALDPYIERAEALLGESIFELAYRGVEHEAKRPLGEIQSGRSSLIDQVTAEVSRAIVKYPTWPTDPLHALAVLGEEFGELNKAMLQLTYEPYKTNAEAVREEAVQTAAMALRLAASLDRYRYAPCHQHSQNEVAMVTNRCSEGDQYIGMPLSELENIATKRG